MSDNNSIIGFLALSSLKGIGPAFIKKNTSRNTFKTGAILEEIRLITAENNKPFDDDIIYNAIEHAKEVIGQCDEDGIKIIHLTSADYPELLQEIKDPPPILYYKGNTELLHSKIVGIIGTREPNDTGIKISERIGQHFFDANWSICNGLALGVDSCSIKKNNDIGGNAIGVLAGGLNFNTKKTLLKKTAENAQLILDNNGLIVSEIPPDMKEDTFTVVKSCRIQAGLSKGLILIQSSVVGGSKFTIKAFCETNRPLGVIHPVPQDFELTSYEANKEIILHGLRGLSKFVDLKEDKIKTKIIFTIKSKHDYLDFERKMNSIEPTTETFNKSLFG